MSCKIDDRLPKEVGAKSLPLHPAIKTPWEKLISFHDAYHYACRHHAVIDEFGIGVQFLGCGQMLAAAQFDPILGVICDLDDKPQHLEIKLVGLVDAQHKILFRNDQRIRLRLEMRIERLDGLDSE